MGGLRDEPRAATLMPLPSVAVAVAGVVAVTAAMLPFRNSLQAGTAALVLVVPIVVASALGGLPAAAVGVAGGFFALDFFFVRPYGSLNAGQNWVDLVVYVIVAVIVSRLVDQLGRSRRAADRARALQEVDELRAALLRSVSHDLRTPLAAIKASISDLRDPGLDIPLEDRAELLETVEEETDRLGRLVANLLDLGRVEAGVLELHRSPIDVAELVDEAARRLPHAKAAIDIPNDLPLIDGDEALLDRVVTNLLENAVRHGRPPIRVHASVEGQEMVLRVVDRGPGVHEADREVVFEAFERAGAHPGTGTGIGLAICAAFVRAHGGRIWIEDTPGGGATFAVALPVASSASQPAPPSRPPRHRPDTPDAGAASRRSRLAGSHGARAGS